MLPDTGPRPTIRAMSATDDEPEPERWAPRPRTEIGPAPTGDHTGLWIRLALVAIAALIVSRIAVRVRRAR